MLTWRPPYAPAQAAEEAELNVGKCCRFEKYIPPPIKKYVPYLVNRSSNPTHLDLAASASAADAVPAAAVGGLRSEEAAPASPSPIFFL